MGVNEKVDVTPGENTFLLFPLRYDYILRFIFVLRFFQVGIFVWSAASPALRDSMTARTQKDFLEDECERQK